MSALALLLALAASHASPAKADEAAVLEADRRFWQAFNTCNVEAMAAYFTKDLEFYHDKNGLLSGRRALLEQTRKGICRPGGTRIRREALAGTVHFYPIAGYGGILSGEHRFYVTEPGKAEYLDGQGRFTHVWKFADGTWQMRRVLSYDHGPPRSVASPAAAAVPAAVLARYAGHYRSKTEGVATVTADDSGLSITAGDLTLRLQPVSETSFVAPERNLRFDFTADAMAVWENGRQVDKASRID